MSEAQRLVFAACLLVAVGVCAGAGVGLSSASVSGSTSHRTGKSFGLKSLFGFGEAATTVRSAPRQIWKIHKYHGIELRPVLAPPAPAKEYGPPAETYGPIAPKEEPSKGFKLPFKLEKLNIFKKKSPETVTAAPVVYGPPVLPYSPPLEPYKPPSTSYGTPVTSYGTPAEAYDVPAEPIYPPVQAYKVPATYPPAVEVATLPPPREKYLQSIKTIKFPFKKFPKITTETKEPEPLEVYSPDGSSSSDLGGLDDLETLAKLSAYLPEGADSKTTDSVSKVLEHVDAETLLNVLEFLNSKNQGKEPIDVSSLLSLAEYIPTLEKNQQSSSWNLGSLIKSIPDIPSLGKGPVAKLFPLSKKGHPKLLTVLTVLKGLKAAEIAALSHILGLGKKHNGFFGKLSVVGKTIAAMKAGKAATLGLLGASISGVKGVIQKPFKKLFAGKDKKKFEIPSLLPVAVGSISSLGDKFKLIPENLLSKFGGSSQSEGPYPPSGVPDLPSLPDFGFNLPKFPKISLSGGYKLHKSAGAPYVRISYPKKSIETAPYPAAESILPETDADSYSVPFIPTTYTAPQPLVASSSGFYPDPRNHASTYSSASGVGIGSSESQSSIVAPSPVYVPPKESYEVPKSQLTYEVPKPSYVAQASLEALKPIYVAPLESYEVPKETYTVPEKAYEVPKETYTVPEKAYEAPLPAYSAPKQPYQPQITYSPQIPQYIKHTIKLNTWSPQEPSVAPVSQPEYPEKSYQPPSETYEVPEIAPRIRYVSRNQAPKQTLQQAYLVPQASKEYKQVVKAPQVISENYHPIKESRLPMTSYQAKYMSEEYDDDVVFSPESEKEAQATPLNPEVAGEGSVESLPAPSVEEAQEAKNEPMEFVQGQYVPKKKYHLKSAPKFETEGKRWKNNDDSYYPGSLVSYAQIPQSSSYFSNQKNFGLREVDAADAADADDAAYEDTYHAASENQDTVVAAPTSDDAKSAPAVEVASAEESEQPAVETKKAASAGNTRSEKQIKSTDFAVPVASGGFSPSSGIPTTGSSYSRVAFQRSSSSESRSKHEESAEDEVKTASSGASGLPVTVAESLSKPMAGPRGMSAESLDDTLDQSR